MYQTCVLLPVTLVPSQDSLWSPQLIMEDEGLSRLAQTVQVLVHLADGTPDRNRVGQLAPLDASTA